MKITTFVLALALASSPTPADNYHSYFSPEVADHVIQYVVNEEYYEYVDFNGDGQLTIADAVGILRRYYDNLEYGNELTLDEKVVENILQENYSVDCIYWEIDFINGKPCRKYELTVNEITTANIYFEFIDDTIDNVKVEINPFEEIVKVIG